VHEQKLLFSSFCTGIIFTKFELGRPIRSRLTTFLLLIRYVTPWSSPLTHWRWTFIMYRLSRGQTLY